MKSSEKTKTPDLVNLEENIKKYPSRYLVTWYEDGDLRSAMHLDSSNEGFVIESDTEIGIWWVPG